MNGQILYEVDTRHVRTVRACVCLCVRAFLSAYVAVPVVCNCDLVFDCIFVRTCKPVFVLVRVRVRVHFGACLNSFHCSCCRNFALNFAFSTQFSNLDDSEFLLIRIYLCLSQKDGSL